MFAEAATHSVLMVDDQPPHPVTPYSLTLVLAYLHYYTPERLPNGRFIAPKHLRLLAAWIGQPAPSLRSLRQHVPLAVHVALLQAAGFLPAAGPLIWAEPTVSSWLHGSFAEAIATLQRAIACATRWQDALAGLGLQEMVGEDYSTYLAQSLARQGQQGQRVASNPPEPVVWLEHEQAQTWQLCLPPSLPLWLHFDLRQLGDWQPGQPLLCTPLTIATAGQRGYGREVIQWLLETATQRPLPEKQQIQLAQWSRRAHVYRLRTVRLLSVPQPEHLAILLRRKEFRAAVIEQLSPRHAIIRTNVVATLEKWLAGQGYPLVQVPPAKEPITGMTEGAAYQWLGLRLLVGLGCLIPLPCPLPHSLLDTLG
jgi:hypothetical protein